jgi:hypothetical protein
MAKSKKKNQICGEVCCTKAAAGSKLHAKAKPKSPAREKKTAHRFAERAIWKAPNRRQQSCWD